MVRKTKLHVRARREPTDQIIDVLPPSPRALIVEDEPPMVLLFQRLLASRGYECNNVSDVDAAIELLRAISFDLIVLDLRLPGRPGDDLVHLLRESGNTTPILVVTGTGDPAREVTLLKARVDAYMSKPFEVGTFLAVVGALANRPRSMRLLVRFNGDLIVDPVRHEIAWREQRSEVPKKVFGLIWLLASHAGAHFSTRKLCLEMQGEYSDAGAKRMWELVEVSAALLEDLSTRELELISEHKRGYMLRRSEVQTIL